MPEHDSIEYFIERERVERSLAANAADAAARRAHLALAAAYRERIEYLSEEAALQIAPSSPNRDMPLSGPRPQEGAKQSARG